jgi:hypothetical protein
METYKEKLSDEFALNEGEYQVSWESYKNSFVVTTKEFSSLGGYFPRDRKTFENKEEARNEFLARIARLNIIIGTQRKIRKASRI